MEFFIEYLMFFLKVLTLLISVLIGIAGILALNRKPKPKLEIISLNNLYDDVKSKMHKIIKDKKDNKKLLKKAKKLLKTRPSLYVLEFNGDIKASQVEKLRDEITAILSVSEKDDEVLVKLESPGGSVNGYGLAAAQLQRIRDHDLYLTICIDKIAASGGYLMACVADNIIAAPFAIIGSIGVVAQMPNFHRWLKERHVDVELLTAGEYKRTLTLFGENTEKGRKKFQEDLESIHTAFREYVVVNRDELDMDKIATGEHWLAKDALQLKLVDVLQTSDSFLLEKMSDFHAFKILIHSKQSLIEKLLKPAMQLLHPWA